MKDSKFVDSSVWIDYLFNGRHAGVIDSDEILLISALSIFEIKKKLKKNKVDEKKIIKGMEFIKKRSLIIQVSGEIADMAVHYSLEKNLPIIDSLIYASSILTDSTLITIDNDFRGLKDVVML